MKHILAAAFALAAPAAAQDLPWSPSATEACLAGGAEGAFRETCIGQSASVCIDTPDGYTTVGMSYCLGREADYWDGRLNVVYGALMDFEKRIDAELEGLGSFAPPMAPALRDMQRAWIPFRDTVCDYEATQWGGGTGAGPAFNECVMRMTARQALYLEDLLAQKRSQ